MSGYGLPQSSRHPAWSAWLLIGPCLGCVIIGPAFAQTDSASRMAPRTVSAGEIRRLAPVAAEGSSGDRAPGRLGDLPGAAPDKGSTSVLIPAKLSSESLSPRTKTQQAIYLSPLGAPTNVVRAVAGEEAELSEPLPRIKSIRQIDLDVTRDDRTTPPDYARPWLQQQGSVHHTTGTSRDWPILDYRWAPSAVAYHPLYFEDVNLERYGYVHGCLQPGVSCAHFFGNVALLPYHVLQRPPCECVYSLGYARPGSCAPRYRSRCLPIDVPAAGGEAATIAGLILLIP